MSLSLPTKRNDFWLLFVPVTLARSSRSWAYYLVVDIHQRLPSGITKRKTDRQTEQRLELCYVYCFNQHHQLYISITHLSGPSLHTGGEVCTPKIKPSAAATERLSCESFERQSNRNQKMWNCFLFN